MSSEEIPEPVELLNHELLSVAPRPIRVWIDGQCFQSASRLRGIGRAVLETISFLKANHPELDLHLSLNAAMVDEALTARRLLGPLLGQDRIHIWEGLVERPESQAGYSDLTRATEAVLAHHVRSLGPDVVWSPSLFEGAHQRFVSLVDPTELGVPSVVTFHDAIPYRFRDRYLGDVRSRDAYMRHLDGLGRYTLALAVSEFAAAEMRDIHPHVPVVTVSSGLSRGFQQIVDEVQSARRAARPARDHHQLLYVGGLDWRKNVRVVIDALARLRGADGDWRTPKPVRLRLVGDQPGPDVEQLMARATELGVDDLLDFDGFTTDAGLITSYQDCDLAVQPSIMEGFGLTALEAMRAGAPLIAARAGALPEVVGDAALLFDPMDAGELANGIARVLTDPDFADDLRRRGRARCDVFDWEVTAARVAKAIAGVAGLRRNSPPEPAAARARTMALLPKLDKRVVAPDRLAAHLVAAEVPQHHAPRLFIDVTSTLYANHGTGIQRVVTRIAREACALYPNAQLVICDSDNGMEAATIDARGRLRTTKRLTRERIFPRAGDTVLLLDSSWTWHQSFEIVMRDARLRGAQVISVLYDLVPIATPAFCDDGMPVVFERWLRAALRYSDGFMCISEATALAFRDMLVSLRHPHAVKIGHWMLGSDFDDDAPIQTGEHDPKRFLSVATLEPRKGHADIVEAFQTLWADGVDAHLTFVGRPGWGTTALQASLRELEATEPRFSWISDADDARLASEYARAGTLVAASYAEGFGLPLIEAARHGCAVIARDIEVFREVEPGFTRFFGDVDGLVRHVRETVETGTLRPGHTSHLLSWTQSAALLVGRIMDGEFSTSYVPTDPQPFLAQSDNGQERMAGPLQADDISVSLDVLPAHIDAPVAGHRRFAVRLTNTGQHALFSRGRLLGDHAVALSYLTFDNRGELRPLDPPRSRIAFGLGPGQSTILPVDLSEDMIGNPNIDVEFAVVQEGVAWWPQRAPLDKAAHGLKADET